MDININSILNLTFEDNGILNLINKYEQQINEDISII